MGCVKLLFFINNNIDLFFSFCGKSLEPDDFEKIILPYLEEVYTFENAAHVSIMNALIIIFNTF